MVDIHIRVSITFEYKVANQDVQVAFYELNVTHLSNITNSTFLSPTAPQTLEILNLNVSLQIIEQCGFILNNKNFTITYSYFRKSCICLWNNISSSALVERIFVVSRKTVLSLV